MVSLLLQPPGISEGYWACGSGKQACHKLLNNEVVGVDQSAVAVLEVRYRREVDTGIVAAGTRRGSYYTL